MTHPPNVYTSALHSPEEMVILLSSPSAPESTSMATEGREKEHSHSMVSCRGEHRLGFLLHGRSIVSNPPVLGDAYTIRGLELTWVCPVRGPEGHRHQVSAGCNKQHHEAMQRACPTVGNNLGSQRSGELRASFIALPLSMFP